MTTSRPIRALQRGLHALAVLNVHDGATVAEVSAAIRLPRTTTYRILATLCEAGYVLRDPEDDRFRLTNLVRGLADAFDDEAAIAQLAKNYVYELCRDVAWPAAVATLSGTAMMVRETADHRVPLAAERYSARFRAPLLGTASGRAYLAHCAPQHRDALLDVLAQSPQAAERPPRDRETLLAQLAEIRRLGHATAVHARRADDLVTLAAPVTVDGRVLASVSVRFAGNAVAMPDAVERILPRIRDAATKIAARFAEQQGTPSGAGSGAA